MAQAVVDRGTSKATVAQVFGIPVTTVTEWARRYRKYGTDTKRWAEEGKPARKEAERASAARGGPAASGGGADAARAPGAGHAAHPRRAGALRGPGRLGDDGAADPARGGATGDAYPSRRPSRGPPEQRFERAEPNQLWQSDIFTFLLRRHQRLYVTAFMDDYSRYLVSLVVAHHQRASLVMEALARGIAEYGAPREVLTDQGRQYDGVARPDGLRGGAAPSGHPAHQEPAAPSADAGQDRALLEDAVGGISVADGVCGLRGLPAADRRSSCRPTTSGVRTRASRARCRRTASSGRRRRCGRRSRRAWRANALALAQERPQRKPFYLVGRLGEQDLSIVLAGRGLTGEAGRDGADDRAGRGGRAMKRRRRRGAGHGRHRPRPTPKWLLKSEEIDRIAQAEVPAGAERALGGDAGDGGDRGGGDLAGDVLPAGDAGAERDAAGAGPAGERGGVGERARCGRSRPWRRR